SLCLSLLSQCSHRLSHVVCRHALNRNPPSNAPSTPTTMSPMTPKPPPFMSCPASPPATNPTTMNQMNAIMRSSSKRFDYTTLLGNNEPNVRRLGPVAPLCPFTFSRNRNRAAVRLVAMVSPASRLCGLQFGLYLHL